MRKQSSDIRTMAGLLAIEWFAENKFEICNVRLLVEHGITDIDQIATVLRSDVDPDDFVSVGDLAPTEENLKLLSTVGVEIMTNDRENAQEWAQLLDDFDLYHEEVTGFRQADRAPSFARKIYGLFERENVSRAELDAFDLSLPYSELAKRIQSGVDTKDQAIWDALGVSLESAIAYGNEGLGAYRAKVLAEVHGVDRANWLKYADLPDHWIGARDVGVSFHRQPPVDWATLDELLALRQRGYVFEDSGSAPWSASLDKKSWYDGMKFSLPQALMLANADMTTKQIARLWSAGSTTGRRAVENAPPHLLPFRVGSNSSGPSDEDIADLIHLYKQGIRAAHLNDYRWGGACSLGLIKQAVAAGINPSRVKALREKYGWTRWTSQPKRIQDIILLFHLHAIEAP